MDLLDRLETSDHKQTLVEEAANHLMEKNNCSRQDILDGLQAGNENLIKQFIQLIATGIFVTEVCNDRYN